MLSQSTVVISERHMDLSCMRHLLSSARSLSLNPESIKPFVIIESLVRCGRRSGVRCWIILNLFEINYQES